MRASKTIAVVSRVREEALLTACDEGDADRVTNILQDGANMNMICESGRTPFCAAAHSGNVAILRAMIDHVNDENRAREGPIEDISYSTDSYPSTEEEILPDAEGSASMAGSENREENDSDSENASDDTSDNAFENASENGSCHCGEDASADICDHCAGSITPPESVEAYEPRYYYSGMIRRYPRIKILPYEIQVILNAFATNDDRNGIEEYEVEEYSFDPDSYNNDMERSGYEIDDYEYDIEGGNGPAHEDGARGNIVTAEINARARNARDEDASENDDTDEDALDDVPNDDDDDDDDYFYSREENASGDLDPIEVVAVDEDAPVEEARVRMRSPVRIICRRIGHLDNFSSDDEISEGARALSVCGGINEDGEFSTEEDDPPVNPADVPLRIIRGGLNGIDQLTSDEESLEEGSIMGGARRRHARLSILPRHNTSAWRSGIFSKTDCLIRKVPNPNSLNKRDHFGCRAIHYATMGGHLEALRLLISAGCRVNVGDTEQLSPVHMAAARESTQELLILIEAGAQVNVKTSDKITPLHVAASRGLLENVKILIQKGARVNALDSVDRTPLFMAVSRSHREVVSYLIEKGAKVNTEEIHGYTPLYEAVSQRNLGILKILLEAGARVNQSQNLLHHAVLYKNEDVIRELLRAGCMVNVKEENGDTALIIAAKTLQPRLVQILLENGAQVNIKNPESGESAMVQMTKHLRGKFESFQKIFSLLLDFDLEIDGETGYKALHYAIYNAEDAVAALLIRRGAIVFRNVWDVYAQLATDLFLEALLRENRLLLRLLIYAGYNFRSIRLPDRISPPLQLWLRRRKSKPLKLSEMCRIVVRSKLENKVFERVSFLNIPSSIQSYIKLENIN